MIQIAINHVVGVMHESYIVARLPSGNKGRRNRKTYKLGHSRSNWRSRDWPNIFIGQSSTMTEQTDNQSCQTKVSQDTDHQESTISTAQPESSSAPTSNEQDASSGIADAGSIKTATASSES